MSDDTQEPNGWKVGLAAFGLVVFIGMLLELPLASPVFGVIEGCSTLAFIYGVLHHLGRRNDPRHAKRPSGPP